MHGTRNAGGSYGMATYVIGLDIGTSSIKAVALDLSGVVIATAQRHYSIISSQPGYAELDPQKVWEAFVGSLQQIINIMQEPPRFISLSSCMHSIMAVNDIGEPLTHLLTWADTRSAPVAEELRASPESEYLYRITGTPIHSMSPLCKLTWWLRHDAALIRQAARFISIKEYIWHRLFGRYQVDYSIASATGLFDIEKRVWHMPSLLLCGINPLQLSEAVATHYSRSDCQEKMAALLHIPATTTFYIGGSDGCMANVGSYALEKGTAALTIGTSGAVRVASTAPIYNYPSMTFNYILNEKVYICGGAVNNGGNVLQWLLKQYMPDTDGNDYERVFQMIESVPAGSHGLLFLPFLYGERTPLWDEWASGCFLGIKSHHSSAHFMRAALEGICYELKNVLELVERTSEPIKQVHVSGGFVHSTTWMKLLADVTGKRLYLLQSEDASAIGAALFALKFSGVITDYASVQPKQHLVIEPSDKNYKLYKDYHGIFQQLYAVLRGPMHLLYQLNHNS